jgi:hypothetical protein
MCHKTVKFCFYCSVLIKCVEKRACKKLKKLPAIAAKDTFCGYWTVCVIQTKQNVCYACDNLWQPCRFPLGNRIIGTLLKACL